MRQFWRNILVGAIVVAGIIFILGYAFNVWYTIQYPKGSQLMPKEILEVDKNFKFPSSFPPDPSEAGKKTIEGIDSDHDGVRDDVQRWIYAFVPNEPNKQQALRQMARYFQDSLSSEYDILEVRKKNHLQSNRAVSCLFENFDDQLHGEVESNYLKAKILNTYSRTSRYLDNQTKITTSEMSGEWVEDEHPCDNF